MKLFNRTGNVTKKSYGYSSGRSLHKLTRLVELSILYVVLSRPYVRLKVSSMQELTGVDISPMSICRFLRVVGFTCQKMKYAALQRDKHLHSKFITDVFMYSLDMLIFLDESGCDKQNSLRKYGYGLHGKSHKFLVRGERISITAFMSMAGILDCHITHGTMNGSTFYNFIEKVLLPHLMPFDGKNPHSVVILDNCSIHHIDEIVDMIHEVGTLVHFLPPYLPDYSPIESLFSKMKTEVKAIENECDTYADIRRNYCTYSLVVCNNTRLS